MIKQKEISDPNSCLNKALPSELVFVLLQRDLAAPVAVRAWIAERIRIGKNKTDDEQIIEATKWCETVIMEQATSISDPPFWDVLPSATPEVT